MSGDDEERARHAAATKLQARARARSAQNLLSENRRCATKVQAVERGRATRAKAKAVISVGLSAIAKCAECASRRASDERAEGFVVKLSLGRTWRSKLFGANWQRRYLMLEPGSPARLVYYEDFTELTGAVNRKGIVVLKEATATPHTTATAAPPSSGERFFFTVSFAEPNGERRDLVCACAEAAVQKMWVSAIGRAAKAAGKQSQ